MVEKKEYADSILKRIDDMRASRPSGLDEKWDEETRDYQNEDLSTQDNNRSKLKIPTLTALVDAKHSDEIRAPFIVDFVPRGKDSLQFKDVRQRIWDSVWYNIKGSLVRQTALLQKNITGDAFIMALWRKETKKKKIIKEFKDGIPVWESKDVVTYDDIKLYNVEPRFLLFDPSAQYIDEAVDCAYERLIGKEAFMDYYGNNPMFNQKNVKAAYVKGVSESILKTKEEEERQQYIDMVHIIDYFNVVTDTYAVYANDLLIYSAPMPIKKLPFAHYRNRVKLGSFYSMSERDVVKDLLEEKNVHRNMVIDYNKANIHAPILKQAGIEFDDSAYRIEGNAVWEVGDINGVTRLQTAPIINSPFTTENMFDADITKATGIDINSLVSAQEESATKTISKKRNQLSRLEPGMKYNSYTGDVRLVEIIMEYVDTYYPIERVNEFLSDNESGVYNKYREIRVENAIVDMKNGFIDFVPKKGNLDFFEATPELIKGEFDVRVSTMDDIPVSKELKQQKALETLQIIGALQVDPNTGKLPRHVQPFIKTIIESGDYNKKDFEHLFTEDDESKETELPQIGMGMDNKQVGRLPLPNEMNLGQRGLTNPIESGGELGQLTAGNVGI